MPPRQSITLTEAELRLMKLLWSRGESSVANLTESLSGDTPLAYTSGDDEITPAELARIQAAIAQAPPDFETDPALDSATAPALHPEKA